MKKKCFLLIYYLQYLKKTLVKYEAKKFLLLFNYIYVITYMKLQYMSNTTHNSLLKLTEKSSGKNKYEITRYLKI